MDLRVKVLLLLAFLTLGVLALNDHYSKLSQNADLQKPVLIAESGGGGV
jgi:hypothetical protein